MSIKYNGKEIDSNFKIVQYITDNNGNEFHINDKVKVTIYNDKEFIDIIKYIGSNGRPIIVFKGHSIRINFIKNIEKVDDDV